MRQEVAPIALDKGQKEGPSIGRTAGQSRCNPRPQP